MQVVAGDFLVGSIVVHVSRAVIVCRWVTGAGSAMKNVVYKALLERTWYSIPGFVTTAVHLPS